MTQIHYRLVELGDVSFLTVVSPEGEPLVATKETHSNFDAIVAAAQAGDYRVFDLFDVGRVIERKFVDAAYGRISVRGGQVFYDEDSVLDDAIVKQILGFHEADEDFAPFGKYVDNLMANPQEHSRQQFYRWIENHHFPISDDGCIVAYKGVASDGKGGYTSISSGTAFVNGVQHTGRIPNAVGDVITMPRSEVQHDPHVACHKGLHAGTWEYAKSFSSSGTVMLVKINPRDVVSVPHDCTSQKVRLCRYEVIGFATSKNEALRYVDEVVVGDADKAQAESEVAEAPAKAAKVAAPKKPAGNKSKWFVGDRVVFKAHPRWGASRRVGSSDTNQDWRDKPVLSSLVGKRAVVTDKTTYTLNEGACIVRAGGKTYVVWDDELKVDPLGAGRPKQAKTNSTWDTRNNHTRQKRGPGGRFLPKGS